MRVADVAVADIPGFHMKADVGPLDGIRVFDLTQNFAGPFATLVLADLGADIIKIEVPGRGDEARHMPPFGDDGVSAMFASFNRGKRSVALDLKTEEGLNAALALCRTCDVFIENLRPGRVSSMGLGFESVRAVRPDVVYCSIDAFGSVGPMAGAPGYDAMVQAYSGLMDLTGEPDGPPSRVGTGLIDIGTGLWAALSVVVALQQSTVTGEATRVTSSMVGTAASLMFHHITAARYTDVVPTRTGTAQHNMAPYEALRTADEPVLVAAASQNLYEKLCKELEATDLIDDPRFDTTEHRVSNRRELVAELERSTLKFTGAELEEKCRGAGIPASRVRSVDAFAIDPQLVAMGYWQPTPSSEWDLPVTPLQLGSWHPTIRGPVPALGEHTAEVLAEVEEKSYDGS